MKDTWYENATEDGILGYKLMVQTGDVNDKPIDRNRVGIRVALTQGTNSSR